MSNNNNITNEQVGIKFVRYLSYLATSCLGLMNEPTAYGPPRFLFAIERLLVLLGEIGLNDNKLDEFLRQLEEQKEDMLSDENKLKAFLQDVSLDLIDKLNYYNEMEDRHE